MDKRVDRRHESVGETVEGDGTTGERIATARDYARMPQHTTSSSRSSTTRPSASSYLSSEAPMSTDRVAAMGQLPIQPSGYQSLPTTRQPLQTTGRGAPPFAQTTAEQPSNIMRAPPQSQPLASKIQSGSSLSKDEAVVRSTTTSSASTAPTSATPVKVGTATVIGIKPSSTNVNPISDGLTSKKVKINSTMDSHDTARNGTHSSSKKSTMHSNNNITPQSNLTSQTKKSPIKTIPQSNISSNSGNKSIKNNQLQSAKPSMKTVNPGTTKPTILRNSGKTSHATTKVQPSRVIPPAPSTSTQQKANSSSFTSSQFPIPSTNTMHKHTTMSNSSSTTPQRHRQQQQKQQQGRAHYQQQQDQLLTPYNAIGNPQVSSCVKNILTLLQTYGPLTCGQLEFNLPPLNLCTSMSFYDKDSTGLNSMGVFDGSEKKVMLQEILDILVAVHVINRGKLKNDNGTDDGEYRYYFGDGIPRVENDIIFPNEILNLIEDANKEIKRSKQRIELLKKELGTVNSESTEDWDRDGESSDQSGMDIASSGPGLKSQRNGKKWYFDSEEEEEEEEVVQQEESTSSTSVKSNPTRRRVRKNLPPPPPTPVQQTKATKEFLKTLLYKYPEIVHDPVYAACLRNFNIDISQVVKAQLKSANGETTQNAKPTNPGPTKRKRQSKAKNQAQKGKSPVTTTGQSNNSTQAKKSGVPKVNGQGQNQIPMKSMPGNKAIPTSMASSKTVSDKLPKPS